MEKIPTIFERGEGFGVIDKPKPECDWVFKGEGKPTEKIDGTNIRVTIQNGNIVKVEKRRNPNKVEKAQGIQPKYIDASETDPADKWIFACVKSYGHNSMGLSDRQYSVEAYGHKIQGDPLGIGKHKLYFFTVNPQEFSDVPLGYTGLREYMKTLHSGLGFGKMAEGIVFHHPDGRMAKIKRKDFK